MSSSSWIDLLQRNGLTPSKASGASLRISESTPKSKVKLNSRLSQVDEETVRCREEQQRQSELLKKLTADNSRLISQVEKLRSTNEGLKEELSEERLAHDRSKASLEMAQLTASELEKTMEGKDQSMESLLTHVHSLQDEVQQLSGLYRQHENGHPMLSDLERLTSHNAELCDRLAAMQHSRTVLEREVLTLKRKLLEEKTVNGRLDQLLLSSDRERAALKDQLTQLHNKVPAATLLDTLQREKAELAERLKVSESRVDTVRAELDCLREAQIKEIEERCSEVDSLKAQLQGEVADLQQEAMKNKEEVRQVKGQLAKCQTLNSQLTEERKTAQQRIEQISRQLESESSSCAKLHQQLQKMSTDLEASLSDLEATNISNMLLRQQIGDLEGQLTAAREQLKSRLDLSNEMKSLLDQRASRIRQLERTLSKKREELDVSMETVSELLNASRDSEDVADCVSVSSSVLSSPAHRVSGRTRFSSTQAEVVHLKQRLSDSRQAMVRMEMKLTQVKTENAKLVGSQQALNSIKEQLSVENSRLTTREKEIDGEWRKERERLSNQVNSITAEAEHLRRELQHQREELMARVSELEEENAVSSESQSRLQLVEEELSQLNSILEDHKWWMKREIEDCVGEMAALRSVVAEVEEGNKLTEAVNNATQSQLQVCESSICQLIGEVEILRARKTVVMKYDHQQLDHSPSTTLVEHTRRLESEVTELRALLHQCSCHSVSRDQSCDQLAVSERGLKWQLRCQTRQTNYCRVKLGYALSELRLYKELKTAMDSHVAELQASLESLEGRYQQCLERLSQAEALRATTNP